MKSNMIQALLLLFACFTFYEANSQTIYANREWVENTPVTSNAYYHTASVVHNGNLIVTGNVLNGNGDVDVYTIRYTAAGDTLWSSTESGSLTGGDDYGVDLLVTSSGDVVVTAAIENSGTGYDYAIYRYSGNDGSLEWSYTWDGNGGTDLPAKIINADNINSIFVVGGSQASGGGLSDYGAVKVDTSGNFAWEHFYNGVGNLHDAAVSGTTMIFNQYLGVIGASNQSSGIWAIVLDMVKVSDGTTYITSTMDTTAVTMVEATAMATDDQNRMFITGYSLDGTDKNIQTVAIDSNLNLLWVANHQTNYHDVGNDIGIDDNGYVYVTGYSETGGGKSKAVTIKYEAATGDTIWVVHYGNTVTEDGVKARKIAVEPNGDLYITGSVYGAGPNKFAFFKYDTDGNIELSKRYESDSLNDDGFDVVVDGSDVYLTGFTETISGTRMTSVKYSLQEKDTALFYASGFPVYTGRDLLIRVDTSLVNKDEIDKLENEHWTLDEIFDAGFVTDVQGALEDACDDDRCPVTVYRIFSHMPTTDTISITRSGDTIRIPPFWATFIFEFPEGVDITDASDTLVQLFPAIKYSTYNLVGTLNSVPDDPEYDEGQISLHTDDTPAWPDVHINVEPAWDLETGKRHIKVGVLDGPMAWYHEDFGGEFNTKVDGWDFVAGDDIYSATTNYSRNHGTSAAGIIGAIRNNETGIAGIAGGSYENGENLDSSGAAIYGMRILGHPDSLVILTHYADAIYGSSVYSPGSNYGYGLHIMNNSWGVSNKDWYGTFPNPFFLDTNITLLRESVHFANRNEVVVVASRGNSGLMQDTGAYHYNYPGVLDDDWVLCVGGLGTDGDYHNMDETQEYDYKTSRGYEIDVSSFSSGSHNWTTLDSNQYDTFSGTSAAAPHVAGVAALMLSYLNYETDHYDNLAPEDVEWVLQHTAQDRNVGTHPGYDTLTGYGIVRAGEAFEILEKPKYVLKHFGTDAFPNSTNFSLYSSQDTVTLTERFENEAGNWFLPNIPYVVNTYKVVSQCGQVINANDSIIGAWPRPSSSNVFALFDGNKVLQPRERVSLDSLDNTYGYLSGFIYYAEDTLGNPLGWWPVDTLTNLDLTYSVLKTDTTVFLTIEDEIYNSFIQLYPNPTAESQNLVLNLAQPMDGFVRLTDINGRLVKSIYEGHFNEGQTTFIINIENLSSGIYLYDVQMNDGQNWQLKIIKQ